MKYLNNYKLFNENFKEDAEADLLNLIDNWFDVEAEDNGKNRKVVSISRDKEFEYNDIKDDLIRYLKILIDKDEYYPFTLDYRSKNTYCRDWIFIRIPNRQYSTIDALFNKDFGKIDTLIIDFKKVKIKK